MYLSNLIWIPKNQVNPHLKYKLQYTKINYDGSETEFEFYKETKDEIGIPRYYDKNLICDDRTNFPKITWPDLCFNSGHDYRMGQLESINNLTNYLVTNYGGRFEANTGCHQKGQKILLYSGYFKKVEDIKVGDWLMGIDSTPRIVQNLITGVGQMYKIKPIKGQEFVVNEDHILTLKHTVSKTIIDISVKDYLLKSKSFKHEYKLFRPVAIEFSNIPNINLDPYFVGVLLGDGSLQGQISICTADKEIVDEIYKQATKLSDEIRVDNGSSSGKASMYFFRKHNKTGNPPTASSLRDLCDLEGLYGLNCGNKHIPIQYKLGSIKTRLQVLAGLMDTDGSFDKNNNGFDFISKSEKLSNDVVFICRSVGLSAKLTPCHKYCQTGGGGKYYRVSISGHTNMIPVKLPRKKPNSRQLNKDVLVSGFSVEKLQEDNYYGFNLTGDGRYLLEDFTVTHNSGKSIMGLAVASNLNTPTLVLVHKLDLLDQWKKLGDNTQPLYFPDLKVGFYYRNNTDYKDKHVVISTFQTIYSRLNEIPKDFFDSFGLVIVDESHIISAKTFTEVLSQFTARNILGVSATFRRKDKMEFVWDWYIGPLIHQHKTEKLVGKYYLKHIDTDLKVTGNAGIDGNIISKNYSRNKIILEDIISAAGSGRKILVLSDRTLHCEWFKEQLDKKGIDSKTYIGKNTKVEREEAKQSQIILATYRIFSEGVDVPTLDTLFILTPKTDIEQALGRIQRLAEKKEPLIVYYVDNSPKFISISKRLKRQLEELGFEDGFTTKDN